MEQVFALSQYAQNLTPEYILSLEASERNWWIARLNRKIREEKEAREEAERNRKAKSKSRYSPKPARLPRRRR